MMYRLICIDPGQSWKGETGERSDVIYIGERDEETGGWRRVEDTKPIVGGCMIVGDLNTRHYTGDLARYWCTTSILEIISETETEVVFKTKNSTYRWEVL